MRALDLHPWRSFSELRVEGTVVGAALRTRNGVRPLYVSPGHLCDLRSALDLVLATTTRFRLPEPIRLAHAAATERRARFDRRRAG